MHTNTRKYVKIRGIQMRGYKEKFNWKFGLIWSIPYGIFVFIIGTLINGLRIVLLLGLLGFLDILLSLGIIYRKKEIEEEKEK